MGNLVILYPAILHLSDAGAMRGVLDEIRRVCGRDHPQLGHTVSRVSPRIGRLQSQDNILTSHPQRH
jgi:hypothetical protein